MMKHLVLLLLMLLPLFAVAGNLRGAVEEPSVAIVPVDATMSDEVLVTEQYGQMQQLALDPRERELFWWWHKKKKSTFWFHDIVSWCIVISFPCVGRERESHVRVFEILWCINR
jgi:hypothetical protein